MAGKTSGLLADTPEPDQDPYIPEGSVEEVIQTQPIGLDSRAIGERVSDISGPLGGVAIKVHHPFSGSVEG